MAIFPKTVSLPHFLPETCWRLETSKIPTSYRSCRQCVREPATVKQTTHLPISYSQTWVAHGGPFMANKALQPTVYCGLCPLSPSAELERYTRLAVCRITLAAQRIACFTGNRS